MSFSALPVRRSRAITRSTVACPRAAPTDPSVEALSSTRTSVAKGTAARSRAIASSPRTSSSRCSVLTTQ